MENNQNSSQLINITALGFALGVVFGISGSSVKDPVTQALFYEISSLGLIVATVLMTLKFNRSGKELLAAGFLVFALGEVAMNVGVAPMASEISMGSFGAGMALYVPAFLLICLPKGMPVYVRISGALCTIPFAIAGTKIFLGHEVPSTSLYPSIGYALLSLTFIGIIYALIKRKI